MSQSPWSVKGVDPEAREAAKIAARRAGMTVGQWLSQTIRMAATEQLRSGGRGPAIAEAPRTGAVPPAGFDGAAESDPAAPHGAQPPAPTMRAIFESIQKLSSRIEEAEAKTTAALAPLAEQVDSLAQQIETVKDQTGVTTAPVERAVMRLSERLQKIEQDAKPVRRASRWSFLGSR